LLKESLIYSGAAQKALDFQRVTGASWKLPDQMGFITDDDITGVLSRQ